MRTNELVTFHGCKNSKTADRLIAAHKAGLRVREITHGTNGYPEPFEGEYFVSGFETLDEAREFANANDGEVGSAEWKNGWHAVEGFCPLDRTLSVYDLNVDDVKSVKDEREFWSDELARAKAAAGDDEDDKDVLAAERELEELESCDDENMLVGGELFASEDGHMRMSYDTRNTEIGVMLRVEADDDEEEI